jgi:hypothetical protein
VRSGSTNGLGGLGRAGHGCARFIVVLGNSRQVDEASQALFPTAMTRNRRLPASVSKDTPGSL